MWIEWSNNRLVNLNFIDEIKIFQTYEGEEWGIDLVSHKYEYVDYKRFYDSKTEAELDFEKLKILLEPINKYGIFPSAYQEI